MAKVKIFTDQQMLREERTGGRIKLSTLRRKIAYELKALSKNYQVRKSVTDGEIVVFSKHEQSFFSSCAIERIFTLAKDEGYAHYVSIRKHLTRFKPAIVIS